MSKTTFDKKILAQFGDNTFTGCCKGMEPTHWIYTTTQGKKITGGDVVSMTGQFVGSIDGVTARKAYTSGRPHRTGAAVPLTLTQA